MIVGNRWLKLFVKKNEVSLFDIQDDFWTSYFNGDFNVLVKAFTLYDKLYPRELGDFSPKFLSLNLF